MGVMQVMRSLLMAQPHRESIVGTGGLATFNDDFKGLMKLTIPFIPVQDLHGMPNPYPPRGSKNLIPDTTDTENGYVAGQHLNVDGTTTTNANWYISEYITLDAETTYTWSNRVNTNVAPSICFYDENKDFLSGININSQYSYTFVPPEGAVYCRSSQTTYAFQAGNPTSSAFQLEVGSTATAYRRYSNICQIEGWTGCGINGTGKNIYRHSAYTYRSGCYLNSSGKFSASRFYDATERYYPCEYLAGKTLCFHNFTNGGSAKAVCFYADKDESSYLNATESRLLTDNIRYVVPSNAKYMRLSYARGTDIASMMINIGNSVGTVEAYKGVYLPITFTDPTTGDPLTVYGGTLKLNEDESADLIVDVWSNTFTGAEAEYWALNSGTQASDGSMRFEGRLSPVSNWNSANSTSSKTKSNIFLPEASGRLYSGYPNHYAIYQLRFYLRVAEISTVASLKSFLSEHNLQVVYPITPRTYHFDDIGQLKSFIGQNNVWTDLNGDPTVGYWKHG